ncbi:DUF732 domain-containing protein [Mycobacterium sp. E3198]|uniref:DUF732 domain-containing protein n=1 Tax=Mycobacterium sp. E3198 TaxID=1834143 RepID=UPI0018D417BD|nr:DUF732 domain-containing protein [Mycobacterium sp. E3198]
MKWSTVAALGLPLFASFLSANASAQTSDGDFVGALEERGISVADPDSAVATAHEICAELDRGEGAAVVVLKLMTDTNLSSAQAGYFIGASVTAYCPQHHDALGNPVLPLVPPPPLM